MEKTTLNLFDEIMALGGYTESYVIEQLDVALDDYFGFENRTEMKLEVLPNELYETILETFKYMKQF